jgi:hypothetical protein
MLWAAIILLVVGGMIGAPVASLAASVLAALCAMVATILGAKRTRIGAIIVLAASLGVAAVLFPSAQNEMTKYREHAPSVPRATPIQPAGQQ